VVASVLFTLAIPRLLANVALLPGAGSLELIESGANPTEAGMLRAINAQMASLEVLQQPMPHFNVAQVAISTIGLEGLGESDQQDENLLIARHHLERTLAMAPAQSRAWLMLAGVHIGEGEIALAARALTLSFRANPHFPVVAPVRWPMIFVVDRLLDRETREQAHLEFLAFFRLHPAAATRIALRIGRLAELQALASDEGSDAEMLESVVSSMNHYGP
jgi:hypothetical protein